MGRELIRQADSYKEAAEKVAIACVLSKMIPEYKTFMDLTEAESNPRYIMKMEEWERGHSEVRQRFRLDISSNNKDHHTKLTGKRVSHVFTVAR